MASAYAARGQVVLAIRAGLIEELAANVARRYLDRVTLDLTGVSAHRSGELRKRTFLGRVKLGDVEREPRDRTTSWGTCARARRA